ncbi:MAG TPA: hypothetical protein VMU18_04805, partial [Rhodoblastus sp.]|nr:hypothetical protein [Rhodoblastus sp.]
SVTLSAFCFVVLTITAWRLARANALRTRSSGRWQAWGFLALYLLIPQTVQRTNFVDIRIIVAAALIVPCFFALDLPDARRRRQVAALVLAMIAANLVMMARVWTDYRADYRDIIASFARLPQPTRILVAESGQETIFEALDIAPMVHAPALAAASNDALVSTVMAVKGKQPLVSRPGYERLNVHDNPPASMEDLAAADQGPAETIDDPYLRHWRQDFDYVYYIGAPIPNPLPDLLQEMERQRRYTLYRIRKPGAS